MRPLSGTGPGHPWGGAWLAQLCSSRWPRSLPEPSLDVSQFTPRLESFGPQQEENTEAEAGREIAQGVLTLRKPPEKGDLLNQLIKSIDQGPKLLEWSGRGLDNNSQQAKE